MFFVLVKPEQKDEEHNLHEVSRANNMKTFYSLPFNFYQSFDIQSFKEKQNFTGKLLDLQKNRLQNNYFESASKTPDNRLSNFNNMNRLNPVDENRKTLKVT